MVVALAGIPSAVHAADQTYDATNDINAWDLSTENWDASSAVWINDNNAIFGGTAEAVTVDDAITVANMTFNSDGYSIVPGLGSLNLAAGTSTVNVSTGTTTMSAPLGGGASLAKTGVGTLVLGSANTFGGDTTISNGVLSVSALNQLGGTGVVLDGGTLRSTAGANFDTNAITVGAAGGTINSLHSAGTFRFQFADRLLGSGPLTITGNGTLPLAGVPFTGVVVLNSSNTYNGNIIVQNGGLLEYANATGVASGATVTVNSNGGLSTAGQNFIHPVTVNAGGTLAFQNNNNGIFSGPITVNGATTIRMQNWYNGTTISGAITSTISGSSPITANAGTGAGGTLTLRGFDAKASSADLTINSTSLLVDSSAGTAAASVTRANSLTIMDGNLTVNGVAGQNTNDVFTTLNLNTAPRLAGVVGAGYTTWTLNPNAATSTALTFTNMGTRTAGSWAAINGAVGLTPGAGTRNIFFTNTLSGSNLIGAGGALASGTASVIPWLRDTGGNAIFGYDSTNGIAGVTTVNVNPDLATADQNINWNAATTLTDSRTVNSLQAAFSGVNLGGFTLTVSSGVITADNSTFSNGTLDFGTAEGQLSVHQARQLSLDVPITGSGGLTFVGFRVNSGNPGRLRLGGANNYTGTTNFYGYGSGAAEVYLTNSLALQNTTLNHVAGRGYNLFFGNGGTSGQTAYTFGGLSGSGNLNLNNNNTTVAPVSLTVGGNNESTTYSGVLSSTVAGGSLTKIGSGTLTLTGTSTYTGDTIVNAGILAVDGDALPDAGKLVIDGGKVAPSGVEIVGTLFFGGVQQAAGTWGATGSGASHIDNTRFSGTGVVSVTTAASGYSSWAQSKGLTTGVNDGATQDPDFDGISNLLEYVLGGLPIGAGSSDTSTVPIIQTLDANNLILTFKRSELSESDTTPTVQISTSLGSWTDFATIGATSAGAVTVTQDSPNADLDTVSVIIPRSNEVGGKLFVRLNVIKN
jgi:autotransporter-associated beta strand protein